MKTSHLLKGLSLLGLIIVLSSWGGTGHYKINSQASLSFNTQMSQFQSWSNLLADHASDADDRKDTDPTEAPKHYIDIDIYSEFLNNLPMPVTLEQAISDHGSTFVYDNGILPWATKATYESLKQSFINQDWNQAMLYASDLGHYVADGHMPLHITANYNGQLTGNTGIHSRYESTMINAFISQINYTGDNIQFIQNVDQYIFDYLYASFQYKDLVIEADNYAKSVSGGNTSSQAYKNELWAQTGTFTTTLFKNGSRALAELIYSAWVEAGSPSMTSYIEKMKSQDKTIFKIYPNPLKNQTTISYTLPSNSKVLIEVKNISGQTVAVISDEYQTAGLYNKIWTPNYEKQGIYFLEITTEKQHETETLLLIK